MTIIEQIKAEIERRKGMCTAQIKANPGQTFPFVMEMTGYDKLLSFLSTLESEHLADASKTSPNELEEAAKEYAKTAFKKPHSDNPDEEVTTVRLSRERNAKNLLKAHGVVEEADGREETWEKKSEARATLDVLPDSELLAELRRRGYAGKIYKKIQVIV